MADISPTFSLKSVTSQMLAPWVHSMGSLLLSAAILLGRLFCEALVVEDDMHSEAGLNRINVFNEKYIQNKDIINSKSS